MLWNELFQGLLERYHKNTNFKTPSLDYIHTIKILQINNLHPSTIIMITNVIVYKRETQYDSLTLQNDTDWWKVIIQFWVDQVVKMFVDVSTSGGKVHGGYSIHFSCSLICIG